MDELEPVAILCGGLATRLRPITETIPKSLVEVAGRPFIEWQLLSLRDQEVGRVVLCVGHLGEKIEECVGDGARFGLKVSYVNDGKQLVGTGGALRKAGPLLDETFFVLYGDSYLRVRYRAVQERFRSSGRLGLMTVLRNEGQWDASNIVMRDGRIASYDKKNRTPEMEHIDYGLGMLSREVLDSIPADQSYDLANLYQSLVERGQLAAFEVTDRFYEIGTPEGLRETRDYFERRSQPRMESYSTLHLAEVAKIASLIDPNAVEGVVATVGKVRDRGGRIFFLGVGGSAANASHAVNDFRKIVGVESYAPTDNVSELTARTNDEGWETVFAAWLRGSRLNKNDLIFVLSVGGGSLEPMISANIVRAAQFAKEVGASVVGIVGRDGGFTAKVADAVVVVPTVNPKTVTPHTEAFQAVIWHLIVSHPSLQAQSTKWESVK